MQRRLWNPIRHEILSIVMRFFRGSHSYYLIFSPNTGKYGPEKIPYLDNFHAVYSVFWNVRMTKVDVIVLIFPFSITVILERTKFIF